MVLRASGLVAALALSVATAHASETIARRSGEALSAFAERNLPPQTELATKPVEVPFPPLGKVAVVLVRPAGSSSNYTGWVLAPTDRPGAYRKEVLPPMELAEGLFEVEVQSVFTAEGGGEPSPKLCVLYSYYRTGSGEEGGHATEVYGWRAGAFVRFQELGETLNGLKNARQVRARLKKGGGDVGMWALDNRVRGGAKLDARQARGPGASRSLGRPIAGGHSCYSVTWTHSQATPSNVRRRCLAPMDHRTPSAAVRKPVVMPSPRPKSTGVSASPSMTYSLLSAAT